MTCNLSTQFIDSLLRTCNSSCASGLYFTTGGLQVCALTCASGTFDQLNTTSLVASCVTCAGSSNYIDATGKYCIQTCSDFVYSSTGLKICGDALTCNSDQYKVLTANSISCGACTTGILGKFCVANCSTYASQANGCNSLTGPGNCGLNNTVNGVCQAGATSCTTGYLLNGSCVACTLPTQYIDSILKTCNTSCSSGLYYADGPLKICALTCASGTFDQLNTTSLIATCVPCTGSGNYVDSTGRACIQTCSDFVYSSTGLKICGDALKLVLHC